MAGTRNAQRQVARRTPHSAHHKPVLARARILHHRRRQHATLCLRAVIAESRAAVRQRQVIVYRLRHMDIRNPIMPLRQELRNAVRRRRRIVPTHRHQQLHLVLREKLQVETLLKILGRRLETAHLQYTAALVENLVGSQEIQVLHPRLLREQRAVAPVQTNHAIAVAKKSFGHRGHHRVHSRSGTAPRQYCNAFHHH